MSAQVLADRSGISKGLLWTIENSPEANPSLATLHKIAEALDVTLADFLEREKVQVDRIIPEKPPGWLEPLRESLKRDRRKLDEDVLQALYVLQHRKANAATLKNDEWRWLYDSIEKSFRD